MFVENVSSLLFAGDSQFMSDRDVEKPKLIFHDNYCIIIVVINVHFGSKVGFLVRFLTAFCSLIFDYGKPLENDIIVVDILSGVELFSNNDSMLH